jgi:hypothetical protein
MNIGGSPPRRAGNPYWRCMRHQLADINHNYGRLFIALSTSSGFLSCRGDGWGSLPWLSRAVRGLERNCTKSYDLFNSTIQISLWIFVLRAFGM